MNKKDKNKRTEAREPWEQSIYDTKDDASHSRVEKRQYKKGNTLFLTILVILLLLIIALPIGTFWWIARDKPNDNKGSGTTPSSSITTSSSTKTEESSSSEAAPEDSQTSESTEAPQEETEPVYAEVQSGDGFKQVAERNGITLEQLLELNNMTGNEVIYPGDTLRVQ